MQTMANNIRQDSPIDTSRFLANWNISLNSPDKPFNEAARDSKMAPVSPSALSRFQLGNSIFIYNPTPYGQSLEWGSSKQAPYGMVSMNVLKFRDVLNGAVQNVNAGI